MEHKVIVAKAISQIYKIPAESIECAAAPQSFCAPSRSNGSCVSYSVHTPVKCVEADSFVTIDPSRIIQVFGSGYKETVVYMSEISGSEMLPIGFRLDMPFPDFIEAMSHCGYGIWGLQPSSIRVDDKI
jgi:hypothetical protein